MDDEQWRLILREAVGETTKPIIGTHFRQAVDTAAAKLGLRFPPDTDQKLRFIHLIQRYPDVVSLMRRPGQDFLVVPTGRSDLLAQGVQGRLFGIRRDLFEAFTVVASGNCPYYDKLSDKVIWRRTDAVDELSASQVSIEPTTLESEIVLRRKFVDSLSDQPDASSDLSLSLATAMPLRDFGKTVKDVGVQRKWHSFRTERVVERLQRWAEDKHIEWKDAWLIEGLNERGRSREADPVTSPTVRPESDAINILLSGLDAADIQRITIPLDLVLKALSASRTTR